LTWLDEAPRRTHAVVHPATIEAPDGLVYPALAFAFESPDAEPITAVVVGREMDFRRFQKQLDKAITDSIRKAREVSEAT
jgi:hypothetical protein